MTSYSSTITMPTPAHRSSSGHAKLHKRGSSGSSLPAAPSPLSSSHFNTSYPIGDDSYPATSSTPPTSSTPRMKPSLRKTSASRQADQGRIDLSKPMAENDRLTGLGINDFGARSVSDVPFSHAARRGTHGRTTSVGSNMSGASGSGYRPSQPFVHPMRQTPRPHTPLTISSNASFIDAEEATDVLEDEFTLGPGYRSKRSISISSAAPGAPTPLSQSHTAGDLGMVPKLTSTSQTNLSIQSGKSGKSKLGRARGDTGYSLDQTNTPSSRTSFERAFSFVSRKSDPEPTTRDERIRAARKKFEEKEANKDRKLKQEQQRRQETHERKEERQRRRSEASERARMARQRPKAQAPPGATGSLGRARGQTQDDDEKLRARSYEGYEPANGMTLPRRGEEAGASEKTSQPRRTKAPQSGWVRFSTWFQTRMLGCGGR